MGRLLDWFRGDQGISLDLKRSEAQVRTEMVMPKPPPIDLSAWSLQKYLRNSQLVYACIEKKAQAATDPELIIEALNRQSGEYEAMDNHPAMSLMAKPNPFDDTESFMRSWIASDNIAGVFYAEIVRSRAGMPVELYPLIPLNVIPQYYGDKLTHYDYWVDGRVISYKPEDLLIYRRHPLGSMYSGSSPLIVALGAVDADIASTEFVRGFFNNGGAPSGIVNFVDRQLSEEDMAAYQARWRSKYGRGGSDQGGIAIFDKAQVTYTPVGSNLSQLDSDTQTSINEARICMVFGVPPILIGAYVGLLHVNQRASVRESQQDFWMNTMSPDLKTKRKFLDMFLLTLFEDPERVKAKEIRFNWDMTQVDALQDDLDSIVDRAAVAFKSGLISRNEGRGIIGYDPLEDSDERGDEFFKPAPALGTGEADDPKPEKDGKAADDATGAKLLLPPADPADIVDLEKKTADLGDYAREPTELETKISLKTIEDDQDAESVRLAKILMNLRRTLIHSSIVDVDALGKENLAALKLTPPAEIYGKIRAVLGESFRRGQFQIINELRAQGADLDDSIIGAIRDLFLDLDMITEMVVSKSVNEVQGRVVDRIVSMSLTGESDETISQQIINDLLGESTAWVTDTANGAVNTSIQYGRDVEMDDLKDIIAIYVYSGILDRRICPACYKWDGVMAEDRADLPKTPNKKCKGGPRCRCFVIAVYDTDAFIAEGNEVR